MLVILNSCNEFIYRLPSFHAALWWCLVSFQTMSSFQILVLFLNVYLLVY
ncbi:unnamed protein product [Musa banksii]